MKTHVVRLLSIVVAFAACTAGAKIRLPDIVADHMMLQRGAATRIWGEENPGGEVTVRIGASEGKAVAGTNGWWCVSLDTSSLGTGPHEMTIEGENRVIVEDVSLGDVWLASGQSNMEFPMNGCLNLPFGEVFGAQELYKRLPGRDIRFFRSKFSWDRARQEGHLDGSWFKVTPETAGLCSATALSFIEKVQGEVGGPMAIVDISIGGTSVWQWMGHEDFAKWPALQKKWLAEQESERQERFYRDWRAKNDAEFPPCDMKDLLHGVEGWERSPAPGSSGNVLPRGCRIYRAKVRLPEAWLMSMSPDAKYGLVGDSLAATNVVCFLACKEGVWPNPSGHFKPIREIGGAFPLGSMQFEDGVMTLLVCQDVIFDNARLEVANLALSRLDDGKKMPLADAQWEVKALKVYADYDRAMPLPQPYDASVRKMEHHYNHQFYPMRRLSAKGVIWYQGGSDANLPRYSDYFADMISIWRRDMGCKADELPFFYCQLAGSYGFPTSPGEVAARANVRMEQTATLGKAKNVGMAVILETGEVEVHGRNKIPAGQRLARLALNRVYGRKEIVCDSPIYRRWWTKDAAAFVQFDTPVPLKAAEVPATYSVNAYKPPVPYVRNSPGSQLEGFSVRDEKGVWHWADAEVLSRDTVKVTAKGVREITSVHYNTGAMGYGNLVNEAGLYASCFVAEGRMASAAPCEWPVLKTYEGKYAARVKMPVGGVGTGTISVSGKGALVDWETRNKPEKGRTPRIWEWGSAFVIRAVKTDGTRCARLLQGPLDEGLDYFAAPINHGMPRFEKSVFKAAFPFAQIEMEDSRMPFKVTMETYNPLIPGDSEASGIPAMFIRYRVENLTDEPLDAAISAQIMLPEDAGVKSERSCCDEKGRPGLLFRELRAANHPRFGELAVLADAADAKVSRATDFDKDRWGVAKAHVWNRFRDFGDVVPFASDQPRGKYPLSVMAVAKPIPAHGEETFVFAIGWRYPNMLAWEQQGDEPVVGNYYAVKYPTASAAAANLLDNTADYERRTAEFVRRVTEAKGVPEVVKEAALFNLTMLKTTTCFRTPDGNFYGWEGSQNYAGSCPGNCTHVWGYEHALVDIWPDLARSMLDNAFGPQLDSEGRMRFRVKLPLAANAKDDAFDCADGHCQMLVKAFEYWRKTGDDAWLARMYPAIRRATEFFWIRGGWDADCDGQMEGSQHNTMDVEYFGPNPQMQFLYFAALEAVAAMASHEGDHAFAEKCLGVKKAGSEWTESHLFNGEYYEQEVRPPRQNFIAKGLKTDLGTKNMDDPDFQLASGCLVDQLLGDYAARAAGLPSVVDPVHGRLSLAAVCRLCRRAPDDDLFNNMRGFVYAGETSLRMAWYDESKMPKVPFPYYRETMTGFEYVVAALLAWNGERSEAERVVRDIRDRYDGFKRNPFDEPECGNHYARTLSAWTVFKAFLDSARKDL